MSYSSLIKLEKRNLIDYALMQLRLFFSFLFFFCSFFSIFCQNSEKLPPTRLLIPILFQSDFMQLVRRSSSYDSAQLLCHVPRPESPREGISSPVRRRKNSRKFSRNFSELRRRAGRRRSASGNWY